MEIIARSDGPRNLLHEHLAGLVLVLEWLATVLYVFAIVVMLIGTVRFAIGFVHAETSRESRERVRWINLERVELGRYILAGLELFIVSDIIHTVLSLALGDLVFLALLVLIRAVISYFLDREIAEIRRELG